MFTPPFDDKKVIAGQGTIGLELLEDHSEPIDYLFVPIGGGGLAAGLITVFKELIPYTKIMGVEPAGAASMKTSIEKGVNTTLDQLDKFVDGAAVGRVGEQSFEICKDRLNDIILIPEGKVCTTILRLYNEEALVVEPAGTLTISALDFIRKNSKEKTWCALCAAVLTIFPELKKLRKDHYCMKVSSIIFWFSFHKDQEL